MECDLSACSFERGMDAVAEIVIYTKDYCGYCAAAKRLLDRKQVRYQEIDVTSDQPRWNEMVQRSGRMTVPQIFIGDTAVGGFTDLAALDRRGRLDPMLGLAGEPAAKPPAPFGGLSGWLSGLVSRVIG